jgi:hypothetical protein
MIKLVTNEIGSRGRDSRIQRPGIQLEALAGTAAQQVEFLDALSTWIEKYCIYSWDCERSFANQDCVFYSPPAKVCCISILKGLYFPENY